MRKLIAGTTRRVVISAMVIAVFVATNAVALLDARLTEPPLGFSFSVW
jgi:hypothetical protein